MNGHLRPALDGLEAVPPPAFGRALERGAPNQVGNLSEPAQLGTRGSLNADLATRLLLAVTLVAVPLAFGATEAWGWSGMSCLVMLTVCVWAASGLRRGVIDLAWSPLYIVGGLFVLLGVFQYLTHRTSDSMSTRNALIELAAIVVSFFLVLQATAQMEPKTWRRLGLAIVGYTFGLAVLAMIQYFSSPGKIFWRVTPRSQGWIFGPYLNHDHYAGLMEMLIPLSAGYALSLWRRAAPGALIGFAVLVPVASVLLSGSRGGMVSVLLEVLLLLSLLGLKGRRANAGRMAVRIAATTSVAFLAFLWMDTGQVLNHLETVFQPAFAEDASFAYRIQTARDSLRMFRANWLLGTGLGSFEYAFPRYQSLPGDEVWDHAHDDFVETLAETGIAGGLLVLAAAILWFRLAFRKIEDRLRHPTGWLQLGAAVGCCGLLFHSFFDFNLHIPANALWFAACAALASAEIPAAAKVQGY